MQLKLTRLDSLQNFDIFYQETMVKSASRLELMNNFEILSEICHPYKGQSRSSLSHLPFSVVLFALYFSLFLQHLAAKSVLPGSNLLLRTAVYSKTFSDCSPVSLEARRFRQSIFFLAIFTHFARLNWLWSLSFRVMNKLIWLRILARIIWFNPSCVHVWPYYLHVFGSIFE